MEFRLATLNDLCEIKKMYFELIVKMNSDGIEIWDEIYPCEFFADDISNNSLYILVHNNTIIGAFVLNNSSLGAKEVEWKSEDAKAVYIDRLGVNVNFAKQGIATELLNHAKIIAKEKSAEYLRLFVVDYNIPAINLYAKHGFVKANGIYTAVIDENLSFDEIGFEIKLY